MKEKHIYKPRPCPAYDIESIEAFLGEMAKKGYLLAPDGLLPFCFYFEKTQPQTRLYRLEAVTRHNICASEPDGEPTLETTELSALYGWEYVTRCGDFYVYTTADTQARELNTDPAVQAITLKQVRNRCFGALFPIFAFMIPLFQLRNQLLTAMINIGTLFSMFTLLLLVTLALTSIREITFLSKLIQKLQTEGSLCHTKDWKQNKLSHFTKQVVITCAICLWGCLAYTNIFSQSAQSYTALAEYPDTGAFPFATLLDLTGANDYTLDVTYPDGSTVREWSDLLAPYNADYQENALLSTTNGGTFSACIFIDYHETIHPAIAHTIAVEYFNAAQQGSDITELTPPYVAVDYIKMYSEMNIFTTVIIQKGTTVHTITSFEYSDSPNIDWDAWIEEIVTGME